MSFLFSHLQDVLKLMSLKQGMAANITCSGTNFGGQTAFLWRGGAGQRIQHSQGRPPLQFERKDNWRPSTRPYQHASFIQIRCATCRSCLVHQCWQTQSTNCCQEYNTAVQVRHPKGPPPQGPHLSVPAIQFRRGFPQFPPLLPAMWPYSVGLLDGIHARIVWS